MNQNVKMMLEALAISGSDNCRHKAGQILAGTTTVEIDRTYCGNFLKAVYDGDIMEAIRRADSENKQCLKSLIQSML
jgi:hypothetical protein